MTVAYDNFASGAGAGTDITVNITPVGTPRGVIALFLSTGSSPWGPNSATAYGGTSMTQVPNSPASHGTGEQGEVRVWFLGASVPTGNQDCVFTVDASTVRAAGVITLTADADVEVITTDATTGIQADPSGTLTLGGRTCFCAIGLYSGQNDPSGITPLTNWTARDEPDAGSEMAGFYTYDTIDSTDVTWGWTQTTEDSAGLAIAVSEVAGGGGSIVPILMEHYE